MITLEADDLDQLILIDVGQWIVGKYRRQALMVGTYQAARNMRKQGFPFWIARAVLL